MAIFKFSPLTVKRIRRFKSVKRGYYSLIILCALILISFFAEFLMNSRAIVVKYEGEYYFPTLRFYSGTTFGFDYEHETNYRELKNILAASGEGFVIMPPIPYNPYEYDFVTDTRPPPHPPSSAHLLGTDDRGRDVLARIFYAFRVVILFAIGLTIAGYIIGIMLGATMGYFGGWVDLLVQRFVEVWSSIPFLYVCIIIASIFTPNIYILFGILLLFKWIAMTYYTRTEVYREKAKDYAFAAKSIGASNWRIMTKHLIPNSMVPVISFFPFAVVASITTLTALDFLGYGLPPPTPSWGELLNQGKELLHQAVWVMLAPFFAIVITLLLVTFIGEAIREAFDPKQYAKYK